MRSSTSEVGIGEIAEAEERAASLGINGVPFFIVDGRYGLSGAQPAEAIVEALRRARQPEAAD
jgi:predicted DsbA family dithiol-disulfide isomerase